MTSYELNNQLKEKIQNERKSINDVLELIKIGLERRSYLELGFGSMFDWLTKGFGYSNGAAQRRIGAARMLMAVPEITSGLQEGRLNLTTVSKTQSVIRAHEIACGERMTKAEKIDIVAKIENKSAEETERVLLAIFPDAASSVHQERRKIVNETTTRHIMNLSLEVTADLDRAKEVLSHKLPFAKDADVVAVALKFFLDKNDPLRKSAGKKEPKVVVKKSSKETTGIQSEGKNSESDEDPSDNNYDDPNRKCESTSAAEVSLDHKSEPAVGIRLNPNSNSAEEICFDIVVASPAEGSVSREAVIVPELSSDQNSISAAEVSPNRGFDESTEGGICDESKFAAEEGLNPEPNAMSETCLLGESASAAEVSLNHEPISAAKIEFSEEKRSDGEPGLQLDHEAGGLHSLETASLENAKVAKGLRQAVKSSLRNSLIVDADGTCTFEDPLTGKVCGSRHQLEIDHIKPVALGGGNEPENLRVLCRKHNRLAAERVFGRDQMSLFVKR